MGLVGLAVRLSTRPDSPRAGIFTGVVEVLAAALLLWTGYAAKRRRLRPSLQAAAVGMIYGLVAGLGNLLNPTTYQDYYAFLERHQARLSSSILHTSPSALRETARMATTPASHVVDLLGSVVYAVVFGLLLGWVGSLFYTGRRVDEPTR